MLPFPAERCPLADIFLLVNELSVLLAGRRLSRIRQADASYPNGAPALVAGIGVSLDDAPKAAVLVDMRETVAQRTSRVAVRVLDLTATYSITIDGTAVSHIGVEASQELLLAAWANDINTDGVVGLLVQASVEDADGDGVGETLKVVGIKAGGADYSVSVATTGTAEVDLLADPTSANIRLYFTEKIPKAPGIAAPLPSTAFVGTLASGDWRVANGAQYAVTQRGFAEVFDTASWDRIYCEIFNMISPGADGAAGANTFTLTPRITVGRAVLE